MIRGVILDLDGTVYRGDAEVPGAAAFVKAFTARGGRCMFVTNRANRGPEEVSRQIAGYGVPCAPDDVVTTIEATIRHLGRGRVYLIGEEPLRRALQAAGFTLTEDQADYVVSSLDRGFTYDKLRRACTLIRRGARFIATNADRAMNLEDEVVPGAGSIVAAITAASGQAPLVIGKPAPTLLDLAVARMGLSKPEAIAVGDNIETDIPAGHRAGIRTVLILTGLSSRGDAARAAIQPDWIAESYADLERIVSEG